MTTANKSYRKQIAQAVGHVYQSGIVPEHYSFAATFDNIYKYCMEFVLREQLPDHHYGVGEGNALDWDEHLEAYVKTRADEEGWLVGYTEC